MRRRWATLAVGFTVVVLAASLVPASGGQRFPTGTDKLVHAAGYATIAFTAAMALDEAADRALVGVVLAVAALGAGIEVVQPLAGRTASLLDGLANLAGAAVGALAARVSRSH